MKTKILTILCLIITIINLTGCKTIDKTTNEFTGKVEIAWEDVKSDFSNIANNITNDTTLNNPTSDNLKQLTQTIQTGYEKIKNGITKDNNEEAKKVYEAASKLEYIENNARNINDEERKALELGKKAKQLVMHYYGNGEGNYNDIVNDFNNRLNTVKSFTDEKWNTLIEHLK